MNFPEKTGEARVTIESRRKQSVTTPSSNRETRGKMFAQNPYV
ncbi:MAG: hypothetical protein ABSA45_11690 [Verrucomicrobiota bacterium]